MRLSFLKFSLLGSATLCAAASAYATSTTVLATDSVYAVGTNASAAPSYGGTAPTGIVVNPGVSYFTFSASGSLTVNGGTYNNPDGIGSASGEINTGTTSLSGISSPNAGAISGVFIGNGGPTGAAPTA